MENESEEKKNELEEEEINSETEMDEASYGNEVVGAEINERVKKRTRRSK